MSNKPVLPGPYPVKIVAHNRDETQQQTLNTVNKHFPETDHAQTKHNHSKDKKYVSTTVILAVENEEQLQKLHLDLKAIEGVVMVL